MRLKEIQEDFDTSEVGSGGMVADEISRLGHSKQAVTFLKKNQFYGKLNQQMHKTMKAKSPLERLISTNFRSTATSKINSFNRPATIHSTSKNTSNPKTSSPENASTEQTSKQSKNKVLTIPLHKIIKGEQLNADLINHAYMQQFEQMQKESMKKQK